MASITALRSAAIRAHISSPARLPIRNLNLQASSEAANLKGIADLPGPNVCKIMYWLFVKGYGDRSHLLQVGAAAPTRVYQPCFVWKCPANIIRRLSVLNDETGLLGFFSDASRLVSNNKFTETHNKLHFRVSYVKSKYEVGGSL